MAIAPPVHEAQMVARAAAANFADVGVSAVGRVRCRRLYHDAASCRADVNGHGRWRLLVSKLRDGTYDVQGWLQ